MRKPDRRQGRPVEVLVNMIGRICRKIICPLAHALTACAMAVKKTSKVWFSFAIVLLLTTGSLHAQTPLHDPNLHTEVAPENWTGS